MSEPDVPWMLDQIKRLLGEIDTLVLAERHLTNSMREIISHNTNEIEIYVHRIIRKLDEARRPQSTNTASEQQS
jgi:hypothetical protein